MSKKLLRKITLPTNRVFRFGPLALAFDPGQALIHGGLMFVSHLTAEHRNAAGELLGHYDLGSGVVTINLVNTLVSDAVTGTSVVPTLARYKRPDERLGDAADARIILDLHRALGGAVGQARGPDPGPAAGDPDADDSAGYLGISDGLVERLLELALDRRRERGRRRGGRVPGTMVGGATPLPGYVTS